MMFTTHEIFVSKYQAPNCIYPKASNVDSRMIFCDGLRCERWLHIFCDLSIRTKKKLPDKYYCPNCTYTRKTLIL